MNHTQSRVSGSDLQYAMPDSTHLSGAVLVDLQLDPRKDPKVDPGKARRILANRLSAARSKMKARSHATVSLYQCQLCDRTPS